MQRLLENKTKTQILNCKNEKSGDWVYGIDAFHVLKNWFVKNETLFPTRTVQFEGYNFETVNNIDTFLKHIYGNYMSYPKKMKLLHSSYMQISSEHKKIMKDLIMYKNIRGIE